jgi:hypothetical protein
MGIEKKKLAKPKLVEPPTDVSPIAKPSKKFDLSKFQSKGGASIANVGNLPNELPLCKIGQAGDFVRVHASEDYWSSELCFVNVPVKGQKHDTLHLIDEDLAKLYLPSGKILHFRLALATKPFDIFFLCIVPTRNEDNSYNSSALQAIEQAKTMWVRATSRREEGVDAYRIELSRDADAFPEPKWPPQSLEELIERTFPGRWIETEDHPGLLRLIGARPRLG